MGTLFPVLSLMSNIIPTFYLCMKEWNVMELPPEVVNFLILSKGICQALAFKDLVKEFKNIITKNSF